MRRHLYIIGILSFGLTFGQNKADKNEEELELIPIFWVTDNCSDLDNHYENNECVRRDFNQFINRNLDWSITDNLPKATYVIRLNLIFEKDGEISEVTAVSDYDELNKEIERVSNLYQNKIRFLDKDGNSFRKKTTLPITLVVE